MANPALAYPILALDLDGTLLTDELRITPRTREAIQAARAQGVVVLLTSARAPRSMLRYHRELELETPLIAYNGALVWDAQAGVSLLHQPLASDAARALVDFLRERHSGSNISLECCDRWYVQQMDDAVRFAMQYYQVDPPHGVGCLDRVLADEAEAISKVSFQGNQRRATELLTMLPPELVRRLQITTSDERLCDVMAAGVTKAVAIAWAASSLGCGTGDVLAIGDSRNDIPMLEAAAFGVAMGNAQPEVREAADAVTASNNEEGVAQAIERYVLGQRQ